MHRGRACLTFIDGRYDTCSLKDDFWGFIDVVDICSSNVQENENIM